MPTTTFDVFRYQPDTSPEPYRQSFDLDHAEDLTLLDAILDLQNTQDGSLAIRYSFPTWLVDRLAALHPEPVLEALLAALDEEPALHFRVRPSGTRAEVLAQLAEEGVAAEPVELAPDAVRISDASHRVFETKVMKSGRLQVQDVGSQLIAEVCRPPGGSLEGLTVAEIDGRTYAFVGLERVGGIVVLDVTQPSQVRFVEYDNPRDFSGDVERGAARDLGPEGLKFVPAGSSPTGRALLLVANEVSGTTTAYDVNL